MEGFGVTRSPLRVDSEISAPTSATRQRAPGFHHER